MDRLNSLKSVSDWFKDVRKKIAESKQRAKASGRKQCKAEDKRIKVKPMYCNQIILQDKHQSQNIQVDTTLWKWKLVIVRENIKTR